jgi:hypothetical protein
MAFTVSLDGIKSELPIAGAVAIGKQGWISQDGAAYTNPP